MADKKFSLRKLPNGPEIPLTADLSVGRGADSDLKLVEGSPSRKHARLIVTADSVCVEDLGSTNGTFVNDQRVTVRVPLNSADRIRFDMEEYLFRVEILEPPSDLTIRRPLPAAPPPPAAAPPRTAGPKPPAAGAAAPATSPTAAAAAAPAARAAPAADLVADSGRVKVPAGWVDNAPSAGGNKTQFMTPEQMEAERRRAMAGVIDDAAHGRVDVPSLIVPGESGTPTRIQLRASAPGKREWNVGSEGEREILVKRVGVSALHAKIVNDGNRWKVIDQLSANGTFVNGKRCNVSYLASGDRIAFGSVECTFQLPKGDVAGVIRGHANGGTAGSGSKLKMVLVIAGIAFVITLVVLYVLLNKFGL